MKLTQNSSYSHIINSQLHTNNVRVEMNFTVCNLYLNKPNLKKIDKVTISACHLGSSDKNDVLYNVPSS